MEKEKKFMIIGILILLISLVGSAGTYAWFTWSSTSNTNLTMSIGASSDVIFKNGNDISTNKLAPVFNYTDGESTSFTIINKSTTSFSYRILLNITSIADELKNSTLKYKLVSNNTIITEGDFSGIDSTNKLYEGDLSKGNISYIFYLYIDGNEENDLNMMGKSLSGTITVTEATDTYQLTNEDGTTYTPSYSGSGTKIVRSSAPFSKFKEVRVDGVTIDSSNYTLTEGSTIVTFKESYLKTLSEGEHTFKIISSDGFALGKITIGGSVSVAQMITNLYNNSNKTAITNNSITYQYDTTNNLMKDVGDNIRYYGASPNNYVYFNCSDYSNQSSSTCELWRIIGVFDGKVKIMRNENIGIMSYDNDNEDTYLQSIANDNGGNEAFLTSPLIYDNYDENIVMQFIVGSLSNGQNDYSKSSLQKILNNYYYNSLKYTGNSTYDFTNAGLKNDTTRNMIAETTYYTRGYDYPGIYVDAMYDKERVSGAVNSGNATTWTGKIAIPYPSDYGYAADLSLCQKQLNSYKDATCTANNWMFNIVTNNGTGKGSLVTPQSSDVGDVWCIDYDGYVFSSNPTGWGVSDPFLITPVLSLIPELSIKLGTGTSSDPYQLSV